MNDGAPGVLDTVSHDETDVATARPTYILRLRRSSVVGYMYVGRASGYAYLL